MTKVKTQREDFYTKGDADRALLVVQMQGYKAYIQTLSSCRYQVRWWK